MEFQLHEDRPHELYSQKEVKGTKEKFSEKIIVLVGNGSA
jgi:hypothetical protein